MTEGCSYGRIWLWQGDSRHFIIIGGHSFHLRPALANHLYTIMRTDIRSFDADQFIGIYFGSVHERVKLSWWWICCADVGLETRTVDSRTVPDHYKPNHDNGIHIVCTLAIQGTTNWSPDGGFSFGWMHAGMDLVGGTHQTSYNFFTGICLYFTKVFQFHISNLVPHPHVKFPSFWTKFLVPCMHARLPTSSNNNF